MEKELILEIGTEEIPASFIEWAIKDLYKIAKQELDGNFLNYEEITTYGTPRRLVLRVTALAPSQENRTKETHGPPIKIAFDKKGNYTKAAMGFAKSQGVKPKDLIVAKRDRGEFLTLRKQLKGQKTEKLLKYILPRIILSIPFRKSMKWGDGEVTFARPIRWALTLYGGKIVPFNLEGLKSSSKSYGHRFMGKGSIKMANWDDYVSALRENFVILNQDERKSMIEKGINGLASEIGGRIEEDSDLLETVTNLVEFPVVLKGEFENEFLNLPKEVLISVMKNHQKYFPVFADPDGDKLLPCFIFVCGTPVKNVEIVIKGNERVIKARFSDARFFFNEDKSSPLENKLERLKEMVFLSKVGSYYNKTERLTKLASKLGDKLGLKEDVVDLARAAYLSKADLATQMVFEFPELQGIMGKYYAEISGEKTKVAKAIEEQYMPSSREGKLPQTNIGVVISIADKLDSISSCFISGLTPTGTSDPQALRRQAIGIINIILDRNLELSLKGSFRLSLKTIIDQDNNGFSEQDGKVIEDIIDFMKERFRNITITDGFTSDVVDSVVTVDFDDVLETRKKIEAISEFSQAPDFEPLGIAFKRVVNIVKHQGKSRIKDNLMEPVEKELYKSLVETKEKAEFEIGRKDYSAGLFIMKELKEPVDKFFDNLMVMHQDPEIRQNRVSLLREIRDLFFKIADFSKLKA